MSANVLFDAPGPRAKRNNLIVSVVGAVVIAAILGWVVMRFAAAGQFDAAKWTPFTYSEILLTLLKGVWATLKAAAVATVLALVVGMVFAMGRLSEHRWIRLPATVVLEIFRGLPVLLLMFFAFYLGKGTLSPFWAVVFGLTLYNGMVIAEIIRSGILSLPRGQAEAAYALGFRKLAVMRLILIPQALRAMLPTIIAQVVVLLKDSALGFLVTYRDLLAEINNIGRDYMNLLPTFLVGATIYVLINLSVAALANWLERRGNQKTAAKVGPARTDDA